VEGAPNPTFIVRVIDCSPGTLAAIVEQIKASTDFEHFVYREAELDAVWSLTDFLMRYERDSGARSAIEELHRATHRAHDLLAERKVAAAIESLRPFTADDRVR
jgi:hypothetical protein